MNSSIRNGALGILLAALPVAAFAAANEAGGASPAAKVPAKAALQEQAWDLRAWIAKKLAAGNKKIVIPPGRYRARPEGGSHLLFKEVHDVVIIAKDVEMVCTATVQAIGFNRCTNVTLRGLTIDYDPLPFTQGKIVALGKDKSTVEFELFDGYPDNELEERIEIFDPATRELRRASYYGWREFERTGPRRYRISKGENYRYRPEVDTERVGDFLVTNNQFPSRSSEHAVVLSGCINVRIEDVTLYAAPIFGFLENDCDGSTYRRCKIDRRDPADDPVKRAEPRLRSLNADAYHSKSATKGPAILSCTAHFQGDDCVNINGHYYYVAGSHGKTLRLVASRQPNIAVADPVEFLPYRGSRPADAVAVSIAPDPAPLSEAEKAFIRKLGMVERVRAQFLRDRVKVYTLTMDREVSLPAGSAVCSSRRVGNGFVVKDCDFGDNRSRGILIKASHGEVTGNRITKSRMAAVLISPEFHWMEAACSSDVVVKDNMITGVGETPIRILAPGGNGRPLLAGAHRNISILNNRIEGCPWPLIEVTSTTGLIVEGNLWPKESPAGNSIGSRVQPLVPVLLENCETTKSSP